MTLTAPVQDATVTLVDESGVGISRVFRNEDTDVMSFTESGPDTPATLELKLTSYISRNLERVGLNPAGYFDANNSGHLISRITYNVTGVTGAATDALKIIIREGFTVVCLLAYLLP